MSKIDLSSKLVFSEEDLTSPEIVVEKLISQIKDETNSMVFGKIDNYEGAIDSYTVPSFAEQISEALGRDRKNVDVQQELGELNKETRKFEVFLCTPVYNQYKYRICFIEFGIANYPVKVVLEQSIADEINKAGKKNSYIYSCANRSELEELIVSIICSKKVISVMQEIINIYLIHKDDSPSE